MATTVGLWAAQAVCAVAAVVVLNLLAARILNVVGAPSLAERETGLGDFLEIRAPYGRLVKRFHDGNPGARPRPALATDPDFRLILEAGRRIVLAPMRPGAERTTPQIESTGTIPVLFLVSDACWMAGQSADAALFLQEQVRNAEPPPLARRGMPAPPGETTAPASPATHPDAEIP